MSKEQAIAALKAFLTFVGTFLIGKSLLGTTITDHVFELAGGTLLLVINVVWAVVGKTATFDFIKASILHAVSSIGGILIAVGKLSAEQLETWLGLASQLVTFIGIILNKKVEEVVETQVAERIAVIQSQAKSVK